MMHLQQKILCLYTIDKLWQSLLDNLITFGYLLNSGKSISPFGLSFPLSPEFRCLPLCRASSALCFCSFHWSSVNKSPVSRRLLVHSLSSLVLNANTEFKHTTVKPVLKTTCIKKPPALKDHCSDTTTLLNPFPNDKILDMTKLKAFADDKLNIDKMTVSVLDRVENTEGKGENAGYQDFLLYSQCFPRPSSLGSLEVRIV